MAARGTGKVVYDQEGVFIHSSRGKVEEQDNLIPGTLHVIEKDAEVIVDWRPIEETLDSSNILCAVKDSSSVVELTPAPEDRVVHGILHQTGYEAEWDMVNAVSYKKKHFTNGGVQNSLTVQSKWSFLFSLADLKSIKQNKEGMGWSYFVFCLKDDVVLPALHFHQGGSELLLECLEKYVALCESEQDRRVLLVNCQSKGLSQSFENLLEEPAHGVMHVNVRQLTMRLRKDPYVTTMGSFSKVTNYLYGTFRGTDPSTQRRPPQEMADFLGDAIPDLKINQQEESGFEVITRIDVGTRPDVQRRDPVSVSEWNDHMNHEGRIMNVDLLKQYIFKGGLCHALRKEAWKFLLGYFPWNSTREERIILQKRKTDEYFRMKLQWKSVSDEQESRNSRLRDYRSLIEKDVNRTDRTNKFYEGQDNPGLILLHDILMSYCMYDFDLGK
uniref:TBC1 domain family member 15 n=1 Tax=Leptobrachium leishanense TaxID=445787 RepID=A0A8C5M0B6_9ANUR